jgi:NADH-quinone oxidoreductase subunit G
MSSPISIEINGRPLEVVPHSTIIEAADQAGIYIPRFCYHKKLSVAANCRMCLVEVEKSAKPLPACATPVNPGMRIFTRSDKAKAAQQAVMEFLLINHPLDCPICDQGGQCELQDLAMRYGRANSAFTEKKRAVPDDDLGTLIATEMTRCIHCTRCVRFGTEIAGLKELGATGRGENMKITTYVQHSIYSELSGNMIDLCPVGALTAKPFRFTARAWELKQSPTIAGHDCLGSHLAVQMSQQRVMRVVPRECEPINQTWLSDRDRFSYLGLNSAQRLKQPMIKVEESWQETDWPTALATAAKRLQAVCQQQGPEQLGGLISPSATLEEMYLLQALCRQLGSPHIDYRIRETDTRDQSAFPLTPKAEIALANLEECDVIVLIGSNLQREQPLLLTRLRQAAQRGAVIVSLQCVDYIFDFPVSLKVVVPPDQLLAQVTALLEAKNPLVSEVHRPIRHALQMAKRAVILLGAVAYQHPQAANLRYQVNRLAKQYTAAQLHLTLGANSTGAWIAGAIPHRGAGGRSVPVTGLSAAEMLTAGLKAFLLVNLEPALDCANPLLASQAMDQADCVVALTAFISDSLLSTAQVLLPLALFAETAGTLVNIEGHWQSFQAAVAPIGEVRPGWQILQALAQYLGLKYFDYQQLTAIQAEIQKTQGTYAETKLACHPPVEPAIIPMPAPTENAQCVLMRISEWPLYSVDALVRHADALQQAVSHEPTAAYIHHQVVERFQLDVTQAVIIKQGKVAQAKLSLRLDSRIPDTCVWIPSGRPEVASLGETFGWVQLVQEKNNG